MSTKMQLAYIGREIKPVWDSKVQRIARYDIQECIYLDIIKKQHVFIISKSGGGKSYLARVLAEEIARLSTYLAYAVVIIDPIGNFSTLVMKNVNSKEFTGWPSNDVLPRGLNNCTIWVPAGSVDEFTPGSYDRVFALKASEFSFGTLCYAFDLDPLEQQVSLFREARGRLLGRSRDYTLGDLLDIIHREYGDMGFQVTTKDALITKLKALAELGIISPEAPDTSEMIADGQVAVFDLSQSSPLTAKILINFLAEKIMLLRKKFKRIADKLDIEEARIEKPAWYIPPVAFIIDEAHNYLPHNPVLKRMVKEGRNSAVMMTAISQSMDLTKDVYENITHLFVGPLIFEDDIAAVRAMLPIEKGLKEFRPQIRALTSGLFYYYNMDDKSEKFIRVRPAQTFHPASTELKDERKYFIKPRCYAQPKIDNLVKILETSCPRAGHCECAFTNGNAGSCVGLIAKCVSLSEKRLRVAFDSTSIRCEFTIDEVEVVQA